MSKTSLFGEVFKGFWKENPVFKQFLGTCPTLAITTSALNGIGMGLSVTFVLICSSAMISIFRKLIPNQVRIASYVVIIAAFVTMADLFLKAKFPSLSKALGPYVPLIVVNCIILGRAEAFACKNSLIRSIMDAIGMGLGFTCMLILLGMIRELLGAGTLFNHNILVSSTGSGWFVPWLIMILPPGAFLTFGILVGVFNKLERG